MLPAKLTVDSRLSKTFRWLTVFGGKSCAHCVELPRQHTRDIKRQGAVVEIRIELCVLKREGNHVVPREFEISGRAQRIADRGKVAVADAEVGEVGLVW